MSKATRICFTVEGDFITDMARRLWAEEDRPEHAIRLLKTLCGPTGPFSDTDCMAVLEGRKKLTGNSSTGIKLEDDNAKGPSLEAMLVKLKTERDEARDEVADVVQIANRDVVMVPSHDGAREVPRRKARVYFPHAEAVDGAAPGKAGRLDDDWAFDDAPPAIANAKGKKRKPLRIYRKMKDQLPPGVVAAYSRKDVRRIERDHGVKAESEAERERREEREEQAEKAEWRERFQPTPVILGNRGWLTPEGKFYRCGYAQHARVLWAFGLTDSPANHSAEVQGWIRVTVSDETVVFFGGDTEPATEVQRAMIRSYCNEHEDARKPFWLEEEEKA